jgi:hypothetical protein
MKIPPAVKAILVCHICFSLSLCPVESHGQSGKGAPDKAPVAQRLVRQGAFAVGLLSSLGLGTMKDEPVAEGRLGDMGIAPRNGWIADYPVTPDIVAELRKGVASAAGSGRVKLDADEALKRFADLTDYFGLPGGAAAPASPNLPDPASIKDYFAVTGPPVITYYPPPADYAHFYCLVPFPFQSHGLSLPGFFILKRFHRTLFVEGRVEFVTNTFHLFRRHRVFTIDPIARFNGKTYAGIGAPAGRGFIDPGIRGSEWRLFNGPQPWIRPDVRPLSPPHR